MISGGPTTITTTTSSSSSRRKWLTVEQIRLILLTLGNLFVAVSLAGTLWASFVADHHQEDDSDQQQHQSNQNQQPFQLSTSSSSSSNNNNHHHHRGLQENEELMDQLVVTGGKEENTPSPTFVVVHFDDNLSPTKTTTTTTTTATDYQHSDNDATADDTEEEDDYPNYYPSLSPTSAMTMEHTVSQTSLGNSEKGNDYSYTTTTITNLPTESPSPSSSPSVYITHSPTQGDGGSDKSESDHYFDGLDTTDVESLTLIIDNNHNVIANAFGVREEPEPEPLTPRPTRPRNNQNRRPRPTGSPTPEPTFKREPTPRPTTKRQQQQQQQQQEGFQQQQQQQQQQGFLQEEPPTRPGRGSSPPPTFEFRGPPHTSEPTTEDWAFLVNHKEALPLIYVGNNGEFDVPYPLGHCQSDCDSDSDCLGNLECYQRKGGEGVPGCLGEDDSQSDYCVFPNEFLNPTETASGFLNQPEEALPHPWQHGFMLKLYWEEGYRWQNETIERKWCMTRNYTGSPVTGKCWYGEESLPCNETEVYVDKCSRKENPDPKQLWDFVPVSDDEVLIQAYQENRCFERIRRNITLQECDPSIPQQRWWAIRGGFNEAKFELSQKRQPDYCINQDHHPKPGEVIKMYLCKKIRSKHHETSYWNVY